MIRSALQRVITFLGSAALATGLLVFVSVWSVIASFIPQGEPTDHIVVAWASANVLLEPLARAIGMHHAFTAPIFTLAVLVLGLSTAVCAWRRTKVAAARAGVLRAAGLAESRSVAGSVDLVLTCPPGLSASDALMVARTTLGDVGLRTRDRGDSIAAASPPWSVWGSPVFHWALVMLMVVILVGGLQRSEGIMGIAVGETKADVATSYGILKQGPLHAWTASTRSIRVDALDPDYVSAGLDRGAAPTVSVLDGSGRVLKTQLVYPNMPLELGSLTIHPAAYGFAVTIEALNSEGAVSARTVRLVDLSETATQGTEPVDVFTVSDSSGVSTLQAAVTVPLVRSGGTFVVPQQRQARIVLSKPDGTPVIDQIVEQGGSVTLTWGDRLRVGEVGYYARLSVVDDWSIQLLYAGLGVALLGLTLTAFARQQAVIAAAVEGADGVVLTVSLRLWRNAPTSRGEIESVLTEALCARVDGSES